MEELIKQCIESGWRLCDVTDEDKGMTVTPLIPPEGDPRLSWCATWEKVAYEGRSILVPHWASPGKYKEPE